MSFSDDVDGGATLLTWNAALRNKVQLLDNVIFSQGGCFGGKETLLLKQVYRFTPATVASKAPNIPGIRFRSWSCSNTLRFRMPMVYLSP